MDIKITSITSAIMKEALEQAKEGRIHILGEMAKAIEKPKEKISELPQADTIFIGGTGGDTKDIVELCQDKIKLGGRIVIGVILIETLYSVLQTIEKLDFESVDITQITIGKSRKTKTGTMMLARNPVTVISATKK